MSSKGKSTFLLLLVVIGLFSLLSVACDESGDMSGVDIADIQKELPRLGDGARIAEAIEKNTCAAFGQTWSESQRKCK